MAKDPERALPRRWTRCWPRSSAWAAARSRRRSAAWPRASSRALAISGIGPARPRRHRQRSGPRHVCRRQASSSSGSSMSSPVAAGALARDLAQPALSRRRRRPAGSKGMLVAAVVGALVVAGIVGYVALRPAGAPRRPRRPACDRSPARAPRPPASAVARRSRPCAGGDGQGSRQLRSRRRQRQGRRRRAVRQHAVRHPLQGADADPAREHKLTLARARLPRRGADGEGRRQPRAREADQGAGRPTFRSCGAAAGATLRPSPTGYKNDLPY